MRIDTDLLNLLACPETRAHLVLASEEQILLINQAIERGELQTRNKERVKGGVDGALFLEGDFSAVYPIRDGIPILLIEEQIDVRNLFNS